MRVVVWDKDGGKGYTGGEAAIIASLFMAAGAFLWSAVKGFAAEVKKEHHKKSSQS